MNKFYTSLFLLLLPIICQAQNNVTFSVNMTDYTGVFNTVHVSGSWDDFASITNLSDSDGDGIWTADLSLPNGDNQYLFHLDNWTNSEDFSQGDVCTVNNLGQNQRNVLLKDADVVLPTPKYNQCIAYGDGGFGPHNVSFKVDMSDYTGNLDDGVYLVGEDFNNQGLGNWCGSCTPMTNNGDGTWSTTVPLEEYTYNFKFITKFYGDAENLVSGDPGTTTDNNGIVNRYISVDRSLSYSTAWNSSTFVLPLKLSKFDVKLNTSNQAELSWVASGNDEENTFTIFHGTSNNNLELVGTMRVNHSAGSNSYSFLHDNVKPGANYYQVKSTDNYGVQVVTDVKKIEVDQAIFQMGVYPNPAKDFISVSGVEGEATIYSANGKLVGKYASTNFMDVKELQSGVYYIRTAKGIFQFVK